MKSKYRVCILIVLVIIALSPIGCFKQVEVVNVSAGAGLADAINEINVLYQQERPDVTVITNFAAAGTLQQQIENGAPADVFISPSLKHMDMLQAKHLIIENTRRELLRNKVVLIVPEDSTLGITGFKDLAGDMVKKVVIGDPGSVPIGMYAQEIFTKFGIMDELKPRLVLAGTVRQVLQYVESSNVDAGVVFLTDAKISKSVKVVADAPDEINNEVVYPVALIETGKDLKAASDYEAFLFSEEAGAIFDKYGFTVIKY
ncbi:MAG: molybdate ABC transporter substrate-binding protein [Dehalococcoidia bacterium]|nr:molybdate ABC transporter substrate-binding protein [Dehalococcoidia bacterium]